MCYQRRFIGDVAFLEAVEMTLGSLILTAVKVAFVKVMAFESRGLRLAAIFRDVFSRMLLTAMPKSSMG